MGDVHNDSHFLNIENSKSCKVSIKFRVNQRKDDPGMNTVISGCGHRRCGEAAIKPLI